MHGERKKKKEEKTVISKMFRGISAWLARRSLEAKLRVEEKKREEAEARRKCSVLDSILKSKIPGYSGFSIVDGKIAVYIEPEPGYGEFWNYLVFREDRSMKVRVLSGKKEDALAALATACKWSDVEFLVPYNAKIFCGEKDTITIARKGDCLEKLELEGALAQ